MTRLWVRRALFLLAVVLLAGNASAAEPPDSGLGEITLEQVRPLAKKGNPSAEYNMGVIYARGYGVERDYDKARKWYEKAAAQGYAKAAHNLGVMYRKGRGVPVNNKRAAYWFRKAAKLGEPAAQNNLAVMYAEGLGVDRNLGLAAVWMARAAEAGNESAIANLPVVTAQLPDTSIDGDNVNIRSKPTTKSVVLTQADTGTRVVLLQHKARWSRVLLPPAYVVGWVANSLLAEQNTAARSGQGNVSAGQSSTGAAATGAATSKGSTSAETRTPSHPQRIVGTNNLNVREKPSRQADVLFQLQRGDHVTVMKSRNGWKFIQLDDGRHGWVAGYYLIHG